MKKRYQSFIISILFISFLIVIFLFYKQGKLNLKEEREENEDVELLARIKQEVLMTKDPQLGYVPVGRLEEAKKQWKNLQSSNPKTTNSAQGSNDEILGTGLAWEERGPNNIGGRCRAILIDNNDPTGNTVLVGSVSGGLWRTTNFLNANPTWTQISSVSNNLAITSIAQDPNTPTNMYAGTGEGYGNIDAVMGLGIYKSTDGGMTWALLPSTTTGGSNYYDFNYVQKLAVYNNGDIYASGISGFYCNAGGVLKSTDGGNTWTRVIGAYSGGGVCSNAVDFLGYDIEVSISGDIYATVIDESTGKPNGKIYKSPAGATVGNAGTWTNVAPSPGASNHYWQRIQLACSQQNNSRVYAIFVDSTGGIGSIQRTDDGANTWANVSNTTQWCSQGTNSGTDFSNGQGWYDLTISVDPNNDATVYAAGVDIFSSTNSGSSWGQVSQWASGCSSLPYVHADVHNISFLPGSSTNFIVGCDGGIFYSANGGSSFASKDMGLDVTQYYAAALNPNSGSNYMLAGSQDNGSHVFNSPGINSVTTATGGDGTFCFIDQNNASYQITGYVYATYYLSTNAGASFNQLINNSTTQRGRFINPADYDNTTKYLYCGYSDRDILRVGQVTSGSPTSTTFHNVSGINLQLSAIKVDPNTTDSIWAAFSTADDYTGNTPPSPVLYSIGKASTGSRTITQLTNLSLPGGAYISSIDVENGNPNHLLITVSNYGVASVWESTDKGTTWTSLDNNGVNLPDVPIRWGMIVPANSNVGTGGPNGGILLATEMGVFSTTASNGNSTVWTQNSTNLGNVSTYMLKYRAVDNYLVAATHGRGLFSTNLLSSPLAVTMVSFTGNVQPNYNTLNWSVQNEINNKGYDVEREYEGDNNFTSIGFVPSNTTSSSNKYSFIDNAVDLGKPVTYYRLKMTDLNGQSTYSSTLMLTRNASTQMVAYISVMGNQLYLRLNNGNSNQSLNAQIYDITGRLVISRNIIYQSQYLDISHLAKGVYVLKLYSYTGQQFSQKFLN